MAKRAAEDELKLDDVHHEDTAKRLKSEDRQEIRLLIDQGVVGAIIGVKGSQANEIRDKAGVFLSILKVEGVDQKLLKERVLSLKGSPAQCSQAVELIADTLLKEEIKRSAERVADREGPRVSPGQVAIKLLVHQSYGGAIIGKQGSIIKDIAAQSGARLSMTPQPLERSTDRAVTIVGEPTQIHAATARVLAQIAAAPANAHQTNIPYQPALRASAVPHTAYGLPPYATSHRAASGPAPPAQPSPSSAPSFAPPSPATYPYYSSGGASYPPVSTYNPPGSTYNPYGVPAPTPAPSDSVAFAYRHYEMDTAKFAAPPPPMAAPGPSAAARAAAAALGHVTLRALSADETTVALAKAESKSIPPLRPGQIRQLFAVPTKIAGTLIGPRGATISDVRTRSGCHINVLTPFVDQPEERVVNITGAPSAVPVAAQMLQQILDSNTPAAPMPSGF